MSFLLFPKADPGKTSSHIDPRDNRPTCEIRISFTAYKDGGRGGVAGEGMHVGRACVLTSAVLTRLIHPTFQQEGAFFLRLRRGGHGTGILTHSRHRRIHAIGTLGLAVGI